MAYSTFNQNKNDQLKEPMFLGQSVNVARYDQQKFEIFEKLIEKQLSFFWRPEEVDVSSDRIDYNKLPDHEKHIFISNLKYQTLLDSIQGRSPNVALLPLSNFSASQLYLHLVQLKLHHFSILDLAFFARLLLLRLLVFIFGVFFVFFPSLFVALAKLSCPLCLFFCLVIFLHFLTLFCFSIPPLSCCVETASSHY